MYLPKKIQILFLIFTIIALAYPSSSFAGTAVCNMGCNTDTDCITTSTLNVPVFCDQTTKRCQTQYCKNAGGQAVGTLCHCTGAVGASCGQSCSGGIGCRDGISLCGVLAPANQCNLYETTRPNSVYCLPNPGWGGYSYTTCTDRGDIQYLRNPSGQPVLTVSELQQACALALQVNPSPSAQASAASSPLPYCVNIKIYKLTGDFNTLSSWKILSVDEQRQLQTNDEIKVAVLGNATYSNFDKARFKVNNGDFLEISQVNPFGEYFMSFTIPASGNSFNFKAEVHHAQTNRWY